MPKQVPSKGDPDYVDYVIGLGRLPDLLSAVEGELSEHVAVSDLRHARTVDTLGIETFSGRTRFLSSFAERKTTLIAATSPFAA